MGLAHWPTLFLFFSFSLRTSQHVPWFQSLRSGNMADTIEFGNILGLGLCSVTWLGESWHMSGLQPLV